MCSPWRQLAIVQYARTTRAETQYWHFRLLLGSLYLTIINTWSDFAMQHPTNKEVYKQHNTRYEALYVHTKSYGTALVKVRLNFSDEALWISDMPTNI
jgi:hypothetical protein